MSPSPDEIEAIGEAIASWRTQEYIALPIFTLYVYFCATSISDEVSDITRKDGKLGKVLFGALRYGTAMYIALRLSTDFRTHFVISPEACKVLAVATIILLRLTSLASDVTIGLCVSLLFELRRGLLLIMVLLCSVFPMVYFVIQLVAYAQAPVEPTAQLDAELGYPCAIPSDTALKAYLPGHSLAVYSYLNYARAIVLLVLATVTLLKREQYRGRLTKAVTLDGGLYYLSSAAIRVLFAVVFTPGLVTSKDVVMSPLHSLASNLSAVIAPIIAQRLLMNIRDDRRLVTQNLASTLIFAHEAAPRTAFNLTEKEERTYVPSTSKDAARLLA